MPANKNKSEVVEEAVSEAAETVTAVPVAPAANKPEEKVAVFVPYGYALEDPNCFVSHNGVAYILPRGKTSEVPVAVAEEYYRGQRAERAWIDKAASMAKNAEPALN